jgi:hypothetical protein
MVRSSLLHIFTQEDPKEIYFTFSEFYTALHEFWNLKRISEILNWERFQKNNKEWTVVGQFLARGLATGARPMAENGLRDPWQSAPWCMPDVWSPCARPARWHERRRPAGGQKMARSPEKAPAAKHRGARQGGGRWGSIYQWLIIEAVFHGGGRGTWWSAASFGSPAASWGQGGGEAQRNLEVRWTKVVLTVKEEVVAVDWQNPAPSNALRWLEQTRHRRGEVGMLWGALERRRTKGGAKTASEG